MRFGKIHVNKRKIIFLSAVCFIVIFSFFTGTFILSSSVVKQELERLNYPGSYETKQFSNTKEFYHGNWQAADPMLIVSEHYRKMDFKFQTGTSPSGPILISAYSNINGVSCSIELFDIENKTLIQFRIQKKHILKDLVKSIPLKLKTIWFKITDSGK
jgi:hypothetical protein